LALDRGTAERHPVKACSDEVVFVRPELAATDPQFLLEPAPGEVCPCDSIRTRCVASQLRPGERLAGTPVTMR